MNCVRIQTDAVERIEFIALDSSMDPVTGKTDLLLQIRRISDGWYLDFNDMTFKGSGWTTRQTPLTETNATNDPGAYHYDLDTSAITNATTDAVYECRVDQSPGTDVVNLPATGEIKVGEYVNDIDVAISSRSSHVPNDVRDAILDDATRFSGANIDAAISSRATPADITASQAVIIAAIGALNDLSQADVQAAMTAQGYTVARAALIDNLDAAITTILVAIAGLNDLSIVDIQSALTGQGYTTVRAALLDNLDALVSSRSTLTDAQVWQYIIENGLSAEEIVRLFLAALTGLSAGGGSSSLTFRDNADSKNRIAATVDGQGNRTAIVLDGS